MKKWRIKICCGLIFIPLLMQAQEEKIKVNDRIGIEFGTNVFYGSANAPDQIRISKSVYEYDDLYYGYPNSNQVLNNIYGGIKYESFFYNNRFGFAAGLRFSKFSSEINADGNQKYFIWLFSQTETTANYLTVKNIKQGNYYLGVPLELRYVMSGKETSFPFDQYFKLGIAVNCLLSTTNSVIFYDPAMAKYAGAVEEAIKKPSPLNAWVYPVYGLRFSKIKNIWFNMEFNLLGFLIGKNAHPFIRQDIGMGVQLSVQIPLNKKIL